MATFIADTAVDFTTLDIYPYSPTDTYYDETGTSFTTTLGNGIVVDSDGYGFTYSSAAYPVGGVTTSSDFYIGGSLAYELDDISITYAEAEDYFDDDPALVRAEIFSGNDVITGSAYTDYVIAYAGDDVVYGGLGDDYLFGAQGADTLYGGLGVDHLYGGQGADVIYGGQDGDIILGNLGSDDLYGNLGNDLIYGGQGDDRIYGGRGDDTLIGDRGNDVLSGDLGADLYVFGQNSGADLILGFSQAQGDAINLQGQSYAVATASDGNTLLLLSGGGSVELAGINQAQVNGSFFV